MTVQLVESINLAEARVRRDSEGPLLEVEFITAGWGSSGYYSPEIVEAAAPLFAVGTHMYLDHPTPDEDAQRPARSIRDLCAVVVEAGTYNAETNGVRGVVRPFAPYRELMTDQAFLEACGLSIRASADRVVGEAEGRQGFIIGEVEHVASIDFVTRAGRGGRVLQLLESASPAEVNSRAVARGIAEATADERRQQLSDTVRATYGAEGRYAWVQDFDETTVWFQESPEDAPSAYWAQSYAVADDDMSVTLTGTRTAVRPVTRYLPINADGDVVEATDDPTTRPGTHQEDTMPQIEEAELTRLREADSRVPTLVEERDTAIRERDQARGDHAAERRTNRARAMLGESEHSFNPLEENGLLATLPVVEADGTLDEAAFTTRINEAHATREEAAGAGTVRGMGGNSVRIGEGDDETPEKLREESDNVRGSIFGRKPEKKAV